MRCDECIAAAESAAWKRFNDVGCIYCGARLIQRIGQLEIPEADITARRRVVLARMTEAGHDEAQIRALAKGPLAIQPKEKSK